MLKQTIYRSRCAEGRELKVVTADVLAVSERSNPARGITGGLAAQDGLFVQILEGEAEAVDRLLLELYRDSRHADLQVICTRAVPVRAFPHWAMAYAEFSWADARAIARVFHDPFADPDVLSELMLAALHHGG